MQHEVKQGDCLNSIALEYGFGWQSLWNHPQNAELKRLRQDPNILLPGDQVFIPEKAVREENCATGKRHKFQRKDVPARLRLRLLQNNKPRANQRYRLEIDGTSVTGKTDSEGWINQPIPPNAQDGKLTFDNGVEEFQLQLGHLDPLEEISGIQSRLQNLGLYLGELDGSPNPELADALRGFQQAQGLRVTGQVDSATRNALKIIYGS